MRCAKKRWFKNGVPINLSMIYIVDPVGGFAFVLFFPFPSVIQGVLPTTDIAVALAQPPNQ